MALKSKNIIETAVELGRGAVTRGTELVSRWRDVPATRSTSGSPSTVGARKPGEPRGPKSATAGSKKT